MKDNHKIIKIKTDGHGEITGVMLQDGSKMPINRAILMAKRGIIDGTIVVRGENGGEFLKIDPNSYPTDDLYKLPIFKE